MILESVYDCHKIHHTKKKELRHNTWSLLAKELEEQQEDVDDVEVEDHGGHDVIVDFYLLTFASHYQLGVE
jgi:hypothetical protein